ncbi:hypothetical protein F3Y22_tig00110610pilonHSYRG00039 [Hibiscus syriacus]|uniref:FATC domain-containing protein n=1 Tax=Hibiscus syriacus TaxID=106335 RepID=A0A6A3A0I5_HIBSY|nr:hypothetical protein F3Y22_tig00110610pilonHSYRG00039 [Hibiscus syriacus]
MLTEIVGSGGGFYSHHRCGHRTGPKRGFRWVFWSLRLGRGSGGGGESSSGGRVALGYHTLGFPSGAIWTVDHVVFSNSPLDGLLGDNDHTTANQVFVFRKRQNALAEQKLQLGKIRSSLVFNDFLHAEPRKTPHQWKKEETDYDLDTSIGGAQDEYEGNKDAARALLRLKQKLDGYEEGEMRCVHGQVQQLIQDAIDPERLCQMFPGWEAWM